MNSLYGYRKRSVIAYMDWQLTMCFLLLTIIGWLSIFSAGYTPHASLFDMQQSQGRQLIWIGGSILFFAIPILYTNTIKINTFGYVIYAFTMLVLLSVFGLGTEISGSKSWIRLGAIQLQPAEFMKFSTALALAKYFGDGNRKLNNLKSYIIVGLLVAIPPLIIIAQNETGSALVFAAFAFVLYREGMPGWILACGTGTRNNSWGGKIYQSKNLGYASSDDFIFKINEYKNDIDINDGITKLPIINKCAIVGDFNSWTPAEGAAMTQDPLDPNKYTLTINRFAVTAKEYEYKLTANDKWGVYELPSSGNNTYTFNEAGEFKLIFTADLSTNTLTLEAQKYVSVGATGYSTFSSKHSLDFTGLAIKAYRAEINASKQVVLKQVNTIPNNNGVMLVGEPNAEVIVPFTSESDLNDVTNCFVATDGTADIAASTAGSFNYVFVTSPAGFYNLASALPAANVKVGGAYLHTDTELAADPATSRVGWIFDDEVTGINAVENAGNADAKVVYNLNGQRVMNPAKGLYIVNGKKVIIK